MKAMHRNPAGFSLMEVMIAVALLAIIGGLLYTSLTSSIDAKEAVEKTSNRYHLSRQAMARMVDEISMAYVSGHRSTLDPQTKSGLIGEADALHFTAFGYQPRVADSKRSDQREIGYELGIDERTNAQALRRREQADPDLELDEGGRWQTLLPYVTELEFMFWDSTTEDWKESWDTEEAATLNRLPSRIQIKVTAKMGEDGIEQTFLTQSRIFLQTPLNF